MLNGGEFINPFMPFEQIETASENIELALKKKILEIQYLSDKTHKRKEILKTLTTESENICRTVDFIKSELFKTIDEKDKKQKVIELHNYINKYNIFHMYYQEISKNNMDKISDSDNMVNDTTSEELLFLTEDKMSNNGIWSNYYSNQLKWKKTTIDEKELEISLIEKKNKKKLSEEIKNLKQKKEKKEKEKNLEQLEKNLEQLEKNLEQFTTSEEVKILEEVKMLKSKINEIKQQQETLSDLSNKKNNLEIEKKQIIEEKKILKLQKLQEELIKTTTTVQENTQIKELEIEIKTIEINEEIKEIEKEIEIEIEKLALHSAFSDNENKKNLMLLEIQKKENVYKEEEKLSNLLKTAQEKLDELKKLLSKKILEPLTEETEQKQLEKKTNFQEIHKDINNTQTLILNITIKKDEIAELEKTLKIKQKQAKQAKQPLENTDKQQEPVLNKILEIKKKQEKQLHEEIINIEKIINKKISEINKKIIEQNDVIEIESIKIYASDINLLLLLLIHLRRIPT
jgi:hypothetical protein